MKQEVDTDQRGGGIQEQSERVKKGSERQSDHVISSSDESDECEEAQ